MDGLGHHAQQAQPLVGEDGHHVEQGILDVTAENVAGHELRGGHVLQRGVGEDLAGHLRLGQLVEEGVLHGGVHFEGVAQTHLLLAHTGVLGKGLVQELGGQNGVGGGDGVVGGQIVVLTGVDDHAGIAVDHAGEVLVHDGALHVDVAEQDAVQSVVEHHVQALQSAHGGDLGHTQAGAVVAQPDIAVLLLAHLVQSRAHQAEVLLGGIGAAEALGGGAVRHIVQQGLAGGTDDGDDVGALLGTGLGLDNILVDIAGGHDDVQVGAFLVAPLLQIRIALGNVLVDALHGGVDHGSDGGADLLVGVGGNLGQVQLTLVDGLSHGLGILAGFEHGVADGPRRAHRQEGRCHHVVHHHVGQGDVHLVDAVDAQQAANRALHGDRGVLVNEPLGVVCHMGSGLAGLVDQL